MACSQVRSRRMYCTRLGWLETDLYRYPSKLHEDAADVRNNPYFLLWKLAK